MRKKLIAGNWKMHTNLEQAKCLVNEIIPKISDNVDILVCPPFTNITEVFKITKDTPISIGAQDCSAHKEGAYTGEVSAKMIKSTGAEYVIIGHSERRQYHKETEKTINEKLKQVLSVELKPILCIGETLEERENNTTKEVIERQIKGAVDEIDKSDMLITTIAYEPVWAIGTGKTATPEQAQEVHKFIRDLIKELYDEELSEHIRILYGGSMKPENCKELLNKPDIDGGLIGGAALKPDSFCQIINYDD